VDIGTSLQRLPFVENLKSELYNQTGKNAAKTSVWNRISHFQLLLILIIKHRQHAKGFHLLYQTLTLLPQSA